MKEYNKKQEPDTRHSSSDQFQILLFRGSTPIPQSQRKRDVIIHDDVNTKDCNEFDHKNLGHVTTVSPRYKISLFRLKRMTLLSISHFFLNGMRLTVSKRRESINMVKLMQYNDSVKWNQMQLLAVMHHTCGYIRILVTRRLCHPQTLSNS